MFINKRKMTRTQGANANKVKILSFLLIYLSMKSIKEEIQLPNNHVNTIGGATLKIL